MSYPQSDYTVPPPNISIPPPPPAQPVAAPVVSLPGVPPPFYTQSTAAVSLPPLYHPPPTAAPLTAYTTPSAGSVHYRPSAVDLYSAPPPYIFQGIPPPPYSYGASKHSYETSRSHRSEARIGYPHIESSSRHSPSRHRSNERERELRKYYESHRSRSPVRSHRHYSRSPSRHHSIRSPSSHHSTRSPQRYHTSRSPSRHHATRSPSKHYSSRSPSRHHSSGRSSSRLSDRERDLRKFYAERKKRHAMERRLKEQGIDPESLRECRKRHSPSQSRSRSTHEDNDHRQSTSRHTNRSPSRLTNRSPSRLTNRSTSRLTNQSPSRLSNRSPSRLTNRSPSRLTNRSPSRLTNWSPSRLTNRSPSRLTNWSHSRNTCRSPSRETHVSSHTQRSPSPRQRRERDSRKPLTDREKILEEYRRNYCKTSEDLFAKMKQWTKDHDTEKEATKAWYRCSPAELYYQQTADGTGLMQTTKLEKVCEAFFKATIERGRLARPEVDELPPLKPTKGKMCKHRLHEESSSSSSSSSSDEDTCLDDDGLQGYTDRIMLELQRKQNHPRRLHSELWFNNTGEMNGGPLCRCSARARRFGIRHGVYAGEQSFPKCIPTENNLKQLYHYRITVSPPTNFLIKCPTIIAHDEHEFLFSGFSMFSHYKLAKLPTCKVIRFNIEYTILYVDEPAPQNFTVQELDLFEEFLFYELLELVDLDLGKATETSCSQFHFMPRFVRHLPEGGCEVLSMCEVLKYLLNESGLLIPPDMLREVHKMDPYTWQKFVDRIKGMIVTYPGRKPCSVRVDQLDRSPPADLKDRESRREFYPEIVHFGIRPPQLSYAGNPEYQKAWRYYVKYRHLIANMAKPSTSERQKLAAKEGKLQDMRTQSKMKRDVTVAISSKGFHTTGLMCDVVQHAMLIPVLVRHLRFHKSLDSLESKIGYVFEQRALLQTALTHPSYRENFGTNPDHARNSLTNCGIRQPEYGDRRIHYTRKKGIVTLINIMSRFGKHNATESVIKHNERLEFLGDAVVEFLSSIHLFTMFPGLAEGGLATYRAAIVQNQHLALLAKNLGLEQYMLYAHGSDLCRDVVMRHAMANCFEALMGALYLDAGVKVADRVFSLALWFNEPDLLETWNKERRHPLQEQEPLGDRKYIKDFEFLQRLTEFEESIGVQFKHIRLLARAFTDRSVGFTHLTLGSNQRLEFLGDTVLQLVVSGRLYRYFPDHHEGHLSLLRSSLVNNRTQATVCDDLNMSTYAIYNNPKAKPTTKKHKADLLESFLGALFVDKNIEYCEAFCNACLFPRLQEFIMNQDWNDPKSKLQQCCLTLRTMEGGEPDIPVYKVIECLGPTNTRVYTVAVYFRGARLAAARGHSIQEAEMMAAESALSEAHALFPQLDHQQRVIAKTMKSKNKKGEKALVNKKLVLKARIPKAYRLDKSDSSDDESQEGDESDKDSDKSDKSTDKSDKDTGKSDSGNSSEDSGSDSDNSLADNRLSKVKVSSLLHDMQKLKEGLIERNEYDKFKEKCKQYESDDDDDDLATGT